MYDCRRAHHPFTHTYTHTQANLSGGQRARLGLARMAYGDAALYVIDDALSALDPKVGRRVFGRLILGLLAGRTRVLATHQLQYLMVRNTISDFPSPSDFFQPSV